MNKIGFIVDSSSGLTEEDARKRGWGFLPLIVNVDGVDFHDGIDTDAEEFYAGFVIEKNIKTGATPPGLITSLFDKFSKKYDDVIVFGLSTELSSQSNNLLLNAKGYTNIHVVNSKSVGHFIVETVEKMQKMAEENKSAAEIASYANEISARQYAYIIPKTMKWFVRGGRITPAAASLAKLLKIVPILVLNNGKIDRFGKGVNFNKTIEKITTEIEKIKDKNSGVDIYHGDNKEIRDHKIAVEGITKRITNTYLLPPVIAVHTGPEAMAIVVTKKKNNDSASIAKDAKAKKAR